MLWQREKLMNSSSKNTEEAYNNISEAAAAGRVGGVKSGDMLELRLGFGSASPKVNMHGTSSVSVSESSSSSSFPSQPKNQSQEPALGLKLGIETKNHSVELSRNHHGLLCGHQYLSNSLPFPSSCSSSSSLSSTMLHPLPSSPSSNFTRVHGFSWPVPTVGHHCSGRPHPGFWFSLRSIINRHGERLPQIPKAYIRVKNENVTVFMVKTYLVRKLALSSEYQVDISCMGQNLSPSLTMKNVRDEIWLPKFLEFLNSDPIFHRLMSLDYEKCCF